MSTDEILANFRILKEQVRRRGTAAVAAEWADADRLPTVAVLRSMATAIEITLDHFDDHVLADWLEEARQAIRAGTDPVAVRLRLADLVINCGRSE